MMNKLVLAVSLAILSVPICGIAQSPFDGTWKLDMSKASFSAKPDVFVLADNMYECKTCVPPYKIKADGTDQPVTGHPYFDSVAIKVVSSREIEETDKKDGKTVTTSTSTVSPDGKTVTFTFSDSSDTNGGPPVTGKARATQVEPGPAGSHAISGSWKMEKVESLSENGVVFTYKVSGNQITMTTPTGQSYTAPLDGTAAPMTGDPGVTSVSVTMLANDTLQETDRRNDQIVSVWTMTVAADGKTAKGTAEDKVQNRTAEFVATRQ